MSEDQGGAQPERVEGREVWVSRDEHGVAAVGEDAESARPLEADRGEAEGEPGEGGEG